MADRYDASRRLGYRDEVVSTDLDPRHLDSMAAAAELWLALGLGPEAVKITTDRRRDPGWDIEYRGWKLDVKWTRWEPGERIGQAHNPVYPSLSVPTWKPLRADLYVLVIGGLPDRFDLFAWADGWASREQVLAAPVIEWRKSHTRKTSGKAAPTYAIGFDYLRPIGDLLTIVSREQLIEEEGNERLMGEGWYLRD